MKRVIVLSQRRKKARKEYYERLYPLAARIYVSDLAPNYPFQALREVGWLEVEKPPTWWAGDVYHRNSTVGGRARYYIR